LFSQKFIFRGYDIVHVCQNLKRWSFPKVLSQLQGWNVHSLYSSYRSVVTKDCILCKMALIRWPLLLTSLSRHQFSRELFCRTIINFIKLATSCNIFPCNHSCTSTFTDISPLYNSETDTVQLSPHTIQPPADSQENTLITKSADVSTEV